MLRDVPRNAITESAHAKLKLTLHLTKIRKLIPIKIDVKRNVKILNIYVEPMTYFINIFLESSVLDKYRLCNT